MRFGFCLIVIILFITIPQIGHARVCATSYPYVQTIEGQHIVIKAIPLDPHSCSPSLGTTEIYNRKKLLYTIDSYIDAPIFPSNDGQYLAIIHRSHLAIAHVFLPEQKQVWDYDFVAIDVLKWGKPYKQFYLKDVIDTALLDHKSGYFSWCYRDWEPK